MIDGWESLFPNSQRGISFGTLEREKDKSYAKGRADGVAAERHRCVVITADWRQRSPVGMARDVAGGCLHTLPDDPPGKKHRS